MPGSIEQLLEYKRRPQREGKSYCPLQIQSHSQRQLKGRRTYTILLRGGNSQQDPSHKLRCNAYFSHIFGVPTLWLSSQVLRTQNETNKIAIPGRERVDKQWAHQNQIHKILYLERKKQQKMLSSFLDQLLQVDSGDLTLKRILTFCWLLPVFSGSPLQSLQSQQGLKQKLQPW